MKKELDYLSNPDYFNKNLLINFNQKINSKKNVTIQFKLNNNSHLGSALKAIYLLEIIFPKKVLVLKIFIKKKKLYFGQKSRNNNFFTFNLNLNCLQFIDFYRFFSKNPLNFVKSKIDENLIINKKLKQFEFNNNMLLLLSNSDYSFFNLNLYHLN